MQEKPPPPLDVHAPLMKLIGTAHRQIRQGFWSRYAGLGLTPQQGWILRVLSAQGPMSLHNLAQWVFMDDPTACRVVKTLQEKNLVVSLPDPGHGRRNIITVAAAGAELVPALDAQADALAGDLEAGLTDAERLQLKQILLKVIANLTPPAAPAGAAAAPGRAPGWRLV
jgi:MarR family transcriptional regulator, lower aerobic nicotinate degradation pathway regulator